MGGMRFGFSRIWDKLVDRYPALEWVERLVGILVLLAILSPLLVLAWDWAKAHWLK